MTGIHKKGDRYVYVYKDQFQKRREISLGVHTYEVACKIASKFLGEPLCVEKRAIVLEVSMYIDTCSKQRSKNWYRDNSVILLQWAQEMHEDGLTCVQDIEPSHLQRWFSRKIQTVKVSSAVAYLFWIKHFFKWCLQQRRLILSNPADEVVVPRHRGSVGRNFLRQADAEKARR